MAGKVVFGFVFSVENQYSDLYSGTHLIHLE